MDKTEGAYLGDGDAGASGAADPPRFETASDRSPCYRGGARANARPAWAAGRNGTGERTLGVFDAPDFDGHEQVVFCHDREAGLSAIIAIHDTTLGPALGGCRMWPYASDDEALADVLRLSRAMTYKHALAGTAQGGGKAVVIGDSRTDKTAGLFHALGRFVDTLGGRYVVAEDVGTSVGDMAHLRQATRHVAGLAEGTGDPSPLTAWGVFFGIKAAVRHKLGRNGLEGLKVAVQGLGHVGRALCGYLRDAGVSLAVTDIDGAAVERAVAEYAAEAVAPDDIYGIDADVFAPCALGGILNDATIPLIAAPIVAGAANNQLAESGHGDELASRGILYAPDYAINAGGVINISFEGDYDRARAMKRTEAIFETMMEIFASADAEGVATNRIADRLALERLAAARAREAG